MDVSTLLTQSRSAHLQYRRLSADTQNRDLIAMGQAIQTALTTRLDAEALDPTFTDPAWIVDTQAMKGQSHDSLVAFYGRYLAPRDAGVAA